MHSFLTGYKVPSLNHGQYNYTSQVVLAWVSLYSFQPPCSTVATPPQGHRSCPLCMCINVFSWVEHVRIIDKQGPDNRGSTVYDCCVCLVTGERARERDSHLATEESLFGRSGVNLCIFSDKKVYIYDCCVWVCVWSFPRAIKSLSMRLPRSMDVYRKSA